MANYFPDLFKPMDIGALHLRNRIVMPPMSTNFGDPQNPGSVTQRHKNYYAERAKGGVGLIIIESTNVNPASSSRKFGLSLHDDKFIPSLKTLVGRIKEHGAACAIQLNHSGRIGPMKIDCAGIPDERAVTIEKYYAASPLPHPMTGQIAHQFTVKQLKEIAGYFGAAAQRAERAGFDAVELHGAHGYLLNEFLSPHTNKRTDRYGGDFKRRCRFPIEVVKNVRDAVSGSLILSYRMSIVEFIKSGLKLEDSILFAQILKENGVDVIHISAGLNETPSTINKVIPPMSHKEGALLPYVEKIKKKIDLPLIAVQRINTPDLANDIVKRKVADLVATGRALIADPYWPIKAQSGKIKQITRCIACNQGCIEYIVMERPLKCLTNPVVGREGNLTSGYRKGKNTKSCEKCLVIGGGVAGLKAAHVLASKGNYVKLVEKSDALGGNALLASILKGKKEFQWVVNDLIEQLDKFKIKVELNKNIKNIKNANNFFDRIIIATGSTPILPKINFSTNKCLVITAKNALISPEKLPNNVVVVGGNSVGLETAMHLCHLNKKVTIIEMSDKICRDLGPLNRVDILERVEDLPINIILENKIIEVNDAGIIALKNDNKIKHMLPDAVVIAMGARPAQIYVTGDSKNVYYIGDCKKIGNALDAIHDAFNTTISI